MKDDPLNRGRNAVAVHDPRRTQPAVFDASKINALLERNRAAAANRPPVPVVRPVPLLPPAPPLARVDAVRISGHCSAKDRSFIAQAERVRDATRGDLLKFIGNETPGGLHGNEAPAELLSGSYRLDISGWSCPHCGTGRSIWSCGRDCVGQGVMHCVGSRGRRRYCACHDLEERDFRSVEVFELRGRSAGISNGTPSPAGRGLVLYRDK